MDYTQSDIDNLLEAAKNATGGDWRVRKTVDESGDYPFPTYDILAVYPYGPQGIACAYQNPYNAMMFAAAPILAEEVKRQRAEIKRLQETIRRNKYE